MTANFVHFTLGIPEDRVYTVFDIPVVTKNQNFGSSPCYHLYVFSIGGMTEQMGQLLKPP